MSVRRIVRRVHGVTARPQVVGECAYTRGQPLCVVEQQDLGHVELRVGWLGARSTASSARREERAHVLGVTFVAAHSSVAGGPFADRTHRISDRRHRASAAAQRRALSDTHQIADGLLPQRGAELLVPEELSLAISVWPLLGDNGHGTAAFSVPCGGCRRLFSPDEGGRGGDLDRLGTHHTELFQPEIEKHHGRVFKLTGRWPVSGIRKRCRRGRIRRAASARSRRAQC